MIPEIMNHIDPDARMYLINALAFHAEWKTVYESSDIYDQVFTNSNGVEKKVSMMHSLETNYLEGEQETGFIKPYAEGYSFAALLPDENISIEDYISSLDADRLSEILNTVRICPEEVYATMPKFKGDFDVILNQILSHMGMPDAFTGNADFTGIADNDLYIENIIHKTYIEVDEQGTKAAAVTAVELNNEAVVTAEPKFVTLDRPFIYMIIDNNNKLPIFIGTVKDLDAIA